MSLLFCCFVVLVLFFFFFKQKTAYEMRISDWSSDVCSSDLIDLSSLEQLSAGDTASIKKLLKELVNSNAEDLTQLMRLLARQDLPGLADLAQRVQGGALIIRAKGLIAACAAWERACRGGVRRFSAAAWEGVRGRRYVVTGKSGGVRED